MVGRTFAHYRIVERIGAGGMGEVYRAHDTKLGRPVALKVLPPELGQDEVARERLLREARTASALNHPHICTIHDVGEAEGQAYIAMECIEGRPLSAAIPRNGLPAETVIRYGTQIADALAHAHDRGVVHRDLKSANVVITPEGRAKVLDFGLARRVEQAELDEVTKSRTTLSAAGVIAGTLAYMAPEQLRGEPADARSDIWALGVMLYEMAAGVQPFQGQTGYELSSAILREPPSPLPGTVPPELRAVIERCLAKEPARRYQGASEVQAVLEAIQRGATARPAGDTARRWWWAAGVGAALAVLVVVLAVFQLGPSEPPAPAWNIKPLTSFVGMAWGPTWSPDSSFVAYGHTAAGPMDLFVMAATGGDPVRLTRGPADDLTPRWSPDGRYLAFVSDRGTGANVYLIPPLGGTERKLVETHIPWLERPVPVLGVLGAVPWSPDADELLFSRLAPTGQIAIWKVNPSTGDQTRLTQPSAGAVDLGATWSFDGSRIAFMRNQGGKTSLWMMDAEGGEPELLLGDEHQNMPPAWTPDNQRLVFASSRSGTVNLWEMDVRSRRLRQVTTGPGTDFLPAVSSTGRIAYTPYSHQVDLYWGQVDQPQEEHQRLTAHTSNNYSGRVSPDGRWILYYSDRTGNFELWLLNPQTGAERQLTDHPGNDFMGDWSPDGREVVFLSDREGAFQVWILEVESGRVRRVSEKSPPIPFEPHFVRLHWSPDGEAIGFVAPGEEQNALWVVDSQGGSLHSVLSGVIGFDWYRDSRHVVYTRAAEDGSGTLELRAADLEAGKDVFLLRGTSAEMAVAPDSHAVAYVQAASHFNMQLHVLPLSPPASSDGLPRPAGEPRALTHGEGAWHVHNGGWSPDGKTIVYSRDTDQGNIYVIQNYQ